MSGHRRNLFAVTAASFIGFTGFTLVMPFLPLYFNLLGVRDVGDVALWSGLSLGVTPALTAFLSPFWGRLADRFGRKIMVERSLVSFVFVMGATAFVTRAWHVFALRAVQGLFAGYGALTLTMAADSAPRGRMAQAIGMVQTAGDWWLDHAEVPRETVVDSLADLILGGLPAATANNVPYG